MFSPHIKTFVLESLRPFRLRIAFQFVLSIIWAIDFSVRPYLLKVMLDTLATLDPAVAIATLVGPACLYIGMYFAMVIALWFYDYGIMTLNLLLKEQIGVMLMSKMMQHSHALYQNHFAGSLGNKIKDVMSGVPDLLKVVFDSFFSYLFAIVLAIGTMWTVNVKFAYALCVWVIVFSAGSIVLSRRARELGVVAAQSYTSVVGSIVDILGNMVSVRLFTGGQVEKRKLQETLAFYVYTAKDRDWYHLKVLTFQKTSFVIYQAVCLAWLIQGYSHGVTSAGDFALILTINTSIVDCLWSLSKDMSIFVDQVSGIAQGLDVVLSPLEIEDVDNAQDLVVTGGQIQFDHVDFGYKDSPLLFSDKSLTIEPGQRVGLVGYSGGGKTTFVNLILRLYDVSGGAIKIDGQDVRTVTQSSLHRAIGVIAQDPSLFHRTVMENIRYGLPEATDEQIVAAAEKAHAHEFIMELSEGYDTVVGDRGAKLSGGQRQRIAIARAILKNAPILVFDEATSQLDSLTEGHIQDSLRELMKDKTTIVIAHRLSTLQGLDRILVFDHGKIVEDGTHDELLANNGLYKSLWDSQVVGFLPEMRGELQQYGSKETGLQELSSLPL